ncbi:hypothetical protein HMPREF9083_0755 [Dialister micraerophilus DSM 19965]|uniref:Uncharacterized protein n=1 Tax=Dialister micraerophilus DSM 19965 TaxID=888062 RepID=F2BX67_9FIRM|nr:hypothetical protein HMPREF9083_0755 [Dialister micraerophilus DSM 19965]
MIDNCYIHGALLLNIIFILYIIAQTFNKNNCKTTHFKRKFQNIKIYKNVILLFVSIYVIILPKKVKNITLNQCIK